MPAHRNPLRRRAYSLALAAIVLLAAHKPPKPKGDLRLDAAAPMVEGRVAGVPVRLRVDPSQWGAIELNPDVAAKLPVTYESGNDAMIGRLTLAGHAGHAMLEINGRKLPVAVATHGRTVTHDADGVIGPEMLAYATVSWLRADAPPATARYSLAVAFDQDTGLGAIDPKIPGELRIHLSFILPTSFATAAAGAELAHDHGGRFDAPAAPIAAPFGLTRPARPLVFAEPPTLAGFRFDRLQVRIADFRGRLALPADPDSDGDIVVAKREVPQQAEPWVTVAADRLGACAEITYSAVARTLTLACAFDRVR